MMMMQKNDGMMMIKRKARKDLGLSHLGCYNSPPLGGLAPRDSYGDVKRAGYSDLR